MFRQILVPLAGTTLDELTVPHAIAMARLNDAPVTLLHVLQRQGGAAFEPPVDPLDWHVRKLEAEGYLDRVATRFRDAGVETDVELLEGQVAEHIIDHVRRAGTDLMVMASGWAGRGSIGAVVGQVLWRSYVSALIVRAPRRPRPATSVPNEARRSAARQGAEAQPSPVPTAVPTTVVAHASPAAADAGTSPDVLTESAPSGAATAFAVATADGPATVAGPPVGGPPGHGASRRGASSYQASALQEAAASAAIAEPAGTGPAQVEPRQAERTPAGQPQTGAGDAVAGVPAEPDAARGLRYRKVLVALDCSRRAECVLPVVRLLAQRHEAKVLLANVVVGPALPRLVPPTDEDLELARRLKERNLEAAEAYLNDVRARLSINAETRLETADSVSPRLHDVVHAEGVDLVVLSAHGYIGDARWPYGDVATNFIGYGDTPLLLVQDAQPRLQHQPEDVTIEQWGH